MMRRRSFFVAVSAVFSSRKSEAGQRVRRLPASVGGKLPHFVTVDVNDPHTVWVARREADLVEAVSHSNGVRAGDWFYVEVLP